MSILTFKPQPRFRKHQNKLASFTLIVVALAFALFKTTFAANISLNNAQTVEYGQGVSQAVACSGGSNITITPAETFTNASGGGSFTFSGFTVSGVPASCYGYDLQINAFDATNNAPLPLYSGSATDVAIWDRNGTFFADSSVSGLTLTTNSTSSYTVTFTTPVSGASSTYKLGIQSSTNTISVLSTLYDVTSTTGWTRIAYVPPKSYAWNFTATTGTTITEIDLPLYQAYSMLGTSADPTVYLYDGSAAPGTQLGQFALSSTSGQVAKFVATSPISIPANGNLWIDISSNTSGFQYQYSSSAPTNTGSALTAWSQGGAWWYSSNTTSLNMPGSNFHSYVPGYYLDMRIIGTA